MLASVPASMLNQNSPDSGIPNRIDVKASRFNDGVLDLSLPYCKAYPALPPVQFGAKGKAAIKHLLFGRMLAALGCIALRR